MEVIYTTTSESEANVIKSLLENNNIFCFLKSESVRNLYGITIDGLAKIEIIVNNNDIALAKEIIEKSKLEINNEL